MRHPFRWLNALMKRRAYRLGWNDAMAVARQADWRGANASFSERRWRVMIAEALESALRSNPVCLKCGAGLDERRLMNAALPMGLCHDCSRGVRMKPRDHGAKPSMSLRTLWERDKGLCWLCLWPVPLEHASRDHVKPRSAGGRNRADNLSLAHDACNWDRSAVFVDAPPLAWLSVVGWIVHEERFTWFTAIPDAIRDEAHRVRSRGLRYPKGRARLPGWGLAVTSERADRSATAARPEKWEASGVAAPQTTHGLAIAPGSRPDRTSNSSSMQEGRA